MSTKKSAVLFDSKNIIPAPLVSLNRTTYRTDDGHGVGHALTATLTGRLVSCKGWNFTGSSIEYSDTSTTEYPADDGDCCKFANILEMQDKVRSVFNISNDYQWFEIHSLEQGSPVIHKWLARVQDVQFKEGLWVQDAEYSITLELVNSSTEYSDPEEMSHTQHSESWEVQFDADNGGAYQLTHTISCQSKQFSTDGATITDGWEVAKTWVNERLAILAGGIDSDISLGFLVSDYTLYNYQKNQTADQLGGTYTVTEKWMLSKYPVIRNIIVTAETPRDGDFKVKVSGNFKSLLNSTESNGDDAATTFAAWENTNGPYNIAIESIHGLKIGTALKSCPISRSVVENRQFIGSTDGTTAEKHTAEVTRVIEFSYEFSDNPESDVDAEVSVSEKNNYIGSSDACASTVTVEGMIQGFRCDLSGALDQGARLAKAEAYYNTLNPMALATGVYTGGGSLNLINDSIVKNTRKGTIQFSFEYSDAFTGGFKKEETISEGWSCEARNSDGVALTTIQIDGNIIGLCEKTFADVVGQIPSTTSYSAYPTGSYALVKSSITKDSGNKRVSYSYTFEDDNVDTARIEIERTTRVGPDKCDPIYSIHVRIKGNGCSDVAAKASAEARFNTFVNDITGYYPTGYTRTSSTVTKTENGNIDASFEFSSFTDAEVTIVTTESYDSQDCGIVKTRVQGEVKGFCYSAKSSAYQAAVDAYNELDLQSYCTGYIISKSRTDSESEGKISFTLDCENRPQPYIEEKTVSVKCDYSQPYTIVTIEGSVTPLCIDPLGSEEPSQASILIAGESAWAAVEATLPSLAVAACSFDACNTGTATLVRSSITTNKVNGRTQYSMDYQCNPSCHRVTGSLEESVEITCNKGVDVVAIVPILGRSCGPLIQNKNTKKETTVTISISFRFKADCCSSKPSGIEDAVTAIINSVTGCDCPDGCSDVNTYTISDTDTWSPCTGRYTRQITRLLECC